MARTEYFRAASGSLLYAKPLPLQTAAWDGDAIAGVENGTTGSFAFSGLDEAIDYDVFEQAGESPASTDVAIALLAANVPVLDGASIADTVWDEPRADHSTAGTYGATDEWISSVPVLTGPYSVTITVLDDQSNTVADAKVRLFRSGESETQVTDLAGQAAFAAGAGTWQVAISACGFQNLLATIVVNADQTPTFNLTPNAVSPPAGPDLCVVQAFVYQNGEPVYGAIVKARLRDANSTIPAAVLSTQCLEAVSDSNGYAELQLVRESSFTSGTGTYIIDIWHASRRIFSIESPIPSQPTATLDQLITPQS